MNYLELLTSKLSERIASYSDEPTDFENKKNEITEIKNIMTSHGFNIANLNIDNITLLTPEERVKIITIVQDNDSSDFIDSYEKKYFVLYTKYKELQKKYGVEFPAPQFDEAKEKIEKLCELIIDFVNNYDKRNEEYIESRKKVMELPKKYSEILNKGEPVEAVNDLSEFNGMLDTFDFSLVEKGKIKFAIGKANCSLIKPKEFVPVKTDNRLNKYQTILNVKRSKYQNIYDQIKNTYVALVNAEETVKKLSSDLNIPYMDMKQAVTCLLLESYINEFNKDLNDVTLDENFKEEYLSIVLNNLESTLIFSREAEKVEAKAPEEIQNEEPNETQNEEPKVLSEDDKLLNQVNEIIKSEDSLLNSIDKDKLDSYFRNRTFYSPDEQVKYNIQIALLDLIGAREDFKTAIADKNKEDHDKSIGKIRKAINLYYSIKGKGTIEKPSETENKDENKQSNILYFTDSNNYPVFLNELDKAPEKDLKKVKKIIDSLGNTISGKNTKLIIPGVAASIYQIYKTPARLSYVVLPNNGILVLTCVINDGDIKQKTEQLLTLGLIKVNEIISKTKDPTELSLMLDEQAGVRKVINDKLSVNKEKRVIS
jgi:hypothetical protein